ncbi:MAG: nuclear transport factor 2 family protein [Dehalococcoidia bacterium]|nr:nuclear transport factor 2 family protein [Dehalococcoidia bacterium]
MLTLHDLQARAAIHRLHMDYTTGVDRMREKTLAAIYTADARQRRIPDGPPAFPVGGPAIAERIMSAITRYDSTQHTMANEYFTIAGDTATSQVNAVAIHEIVREGKPVQYVMMIRYVNAHAKEHGRWRMRERLLHLDWTIERPPPMGAKSRRNP